MKNKSFLQSVAIFAVLFSLASCEKDCESCTVYLINSELYTYQMSMTGQSSFFLKPAETKEIEITAGKTYTITGKPNTQFAHNDFSKTVKCNGECGEMLVEVED